LQAFDFGLNVGQLVIFRGIGSIFFNLGIKAMRRDIETFGDICDRVTTINNLFNRFLLEFFGGAFSAHEHLPIYG